MGARSIPRTRQGGFGTRICRASAASILARSGGTLVCALVLALVILAGAANAATPQPDPSPQPTATSSPSPDPVPGSGPSARSATATSSASSASTPPPPPVVSTSSPPAQQPAQAAPAVPQASGSGVGLAAPTITRRSSTPSRSADATAERQLPVKVVPVRRPAHKSKDLRIYNPVAAARAVRSAASPWRHLFAVPQPMAAVRSLLPLSRRSGLLLLVGAIALFVLAGASASLMRMLMRTGAGLRGP